MRNKELKKLIKEYIYHKYSDLDELSELYSVKYKFSNLSNRTASKFVRNDKFDLVVIDNSYKKSDYLLYIKVYMLFSIILGIDIDKRLSKQNLENALVSDILDVFTISYIKSMYYKDIEWKEDINIIKVL